MRMWMVDPSKLCRQHLLGEHRELHALRGCLQQQIPLKGYVDRGLIEVHNIYKRHEELAAEMERRGYNHKSPMGKFLVVVEGEVDVEKSIRDLKKRCPECRRLLRKRRFVRNEKDTTVTRVFVARR